MRWLIWAWLLLTIAGAAMMGEYEKPAPKHGKFAGWDCENGPVCHPIYELRVQVPVGYPHNGPDGECVVDGSKLLNQSCARSISNAVKQRTEQ